MIYHLHHIFETCETCFWKTLCSNISWIQLSGNGCDAEFLLFDFLLQPHKVGCNVTGPADAKTIGKSTCCWRVKPADLLRSSPQKIASGVAKTDAKQCSSSCAHRIQWDFHPNKSGWTSQIVSMRWWPSASSSCLMPFVLSALMPFVTLQSSKPSYLESLR